MPYRLFIAIELPDAVKDQLVRLRADIPGAAWVKPNAYHLTLRFLGDGISEETLGVLRDALSTISEPSFKLRLEGVGRFPPNAKRPARVLWVGVSAPPTLQSLYAQIERVVTEAGFAPEDRAFHPHITLARLKLFQPEPKVERFLEAHRTFRTEPVEVRAFHLFSSTLTPQGAIYQEQGRYPLAGS